MRVMISWGSLTLFWKHRRQLNPIVWNSTATKPLLVFVHTPLPLTLFPFLPSAFRLLPSAPPLPPSAPPLLPLMPNRNRWAMLTLPFSPYYSKALFSTQVDNVFLDHEGN